MATAILHYRNTDRIYRIFLYVLLGICLISVLPAAYVFGDGLADITPNVIGTSTVATGWITNYGTFQHKVFYVNGRYLVFYVSADGAEAYRHSTDGVTWSSPVALGITSSGYGHAVGYAVQGTKIAYVAENSGTVYYRLGTVNADGTITWDATEKVVASGASGYGYTPSIYFDLDGYNWVAYSNSAVLGAYCVKNSVKDGNWSSASGFPKTLLDSGAENSPMVELAMMTGGKVYAFYSKPVSSVSYLYGNLWNGTSWGGETQLSTKQLVMSHFATTNIGDNIYAVIRGWIADTYDWYYLNYDGTAWGATTLLEADVPTPYSLWSMSNDGVSRAFLVWVSAPTLNHVYYKVFNSSWGTTVDWYTDSNTITDVLGYGNVGAGFGNNKLLIIYLTGTAAPFTVKFGAADAGEYTPPPQP